MADGDPVTPDEPGNERRRFAIFDRWGKVALATVVLLVVGAVGVGAWALGSDDAERQASPDTTTTNESATTEVTITDTAPPTPQAAPQGGGGSQPLSCTAVAPVPSGATDVTTAPVDFDGDGTPDVLRVYQAGGAWHVRAEIGGVGVDDAVLAGFGPTMTAIGGATVDGDGAEEAWVKVGSGSATDSIGVLVYQSCDLQRVELNNVPAEFPIGATVTAADGLGCFGFDVGIEVFSSTSNDGVTYTGTSQIYTIDLSSTPPSLVLGATANQSETNPSPGFTGMSTFNCDTLNAIP